MALHVPKTAVPIVAGAVRQVHDQLEEEARSVAITVCAGGSDGKPLTPAKKQNEVILRFLADGGLAPSSQWGPIQERIKHIVHVDARSVVCASDAALPSGPRGERPEEEETEKVWEQRLVQWRAGRHARRMRKMQEWVASVVQTKLAQIPQRQFNGWDRQEHTAQLRRAAEGCRGAHELLRVGFLSAEQREAVLMLLFAQLSTALRTPTEMCPPYACPAPSDPVSFCGHLCWALWQGCTEADSTEMLLTRTSLLWDLVVVAEQAADDVEREEQRASQNVVVETMVDLERNAQTSATEAANAVADATTRLERAKDDLEQLRSKAPHLSKDSHDKRGRNSSHGHRKHSTSHGHRKHSTSHGHRKHSTSHGHRKHSTSHGHHSGSSHMHDKHRKHSGHDTHGHGKHGKHRRHSKHKLPQSVDEALAKVSEAEKVLTKTRNESERVPRVASAQLRQEWADTSKLEAERMARLAEHRAYCPTHDYLVALLVRLVSSPRGRAAICDNTTSPRWRQRALRALLHAALHAASRMNAGKRGAQNVGARQPISGVSRCGRHVPWAAVFRAAVLAVSALVQSRAGELFEVHDESEHHLHEPKLGTTAPPPVNSSGSKRNAVIVMLGRAGQYLQLMLKVAIAARVKMFSVFSVQPELKLRTMDESANTAEHTSLCVMVIAARLAPLMNECATNKLFEAIAEVSLATTGAAESLREEFERRWSQVLEQDKLQGTDNVANTCSWQHTTLSAVPFDPGSLWPPRAGNELLKQISALSMPGDWLELTADSSGKAVHLDVTNKSAKKTEASLSTDSPGPSKSLDNLLRRSFAWTSMRLCLHGIGCVSLLESCAALGSSSYNGQIGVRVGKGGSACAKATMLGCSSKLANLRQYVADLQVREWALESHTESLMHALADRMLRGKDYFVSLCGTHVALTLNTTLPRARCQRKQWQKQRRERLWQRCWQQQAAYDPNLILQTSSARNARIARQLEADAKARDVAKQLEAEANARDEAQRQEEEHAMRLAEREVSNEIEAALAEAQLHPDGSDNISVSIDVFEKAKVESIGRESVGGHIRRKPSFLPTMTRALLYCRAAPRSAALLARSVGAAIAARALTAAESLLCLRHHGKLPFETAAEVERLGISKNNDVIKSAAQAAPPLQQLLSFLQMPVWVGTKGKTAISEKNRAELAAAAGAGSARSLLLSVAVSLVLSGCEQKSSRDDREIGASLDTLLSLCTVMCQWVSSCALALFPSVVRIAVARTPGWARRACLWFKRLEIGESANGSPAHIDRPEDNAANGEATSTLNAALCGLWAMLSSTRCCHGSEIGAVLRCFMAKSGYVHLLVQMLQGCNDFTAGPASGGDSVHNLATKQHPFGRSRRLCLGTLWAYCGDHSQDEALERAGRKKCRASASDRLKYSSLLHEAIHFNSLAFVAEAGLLHALAHGAGPAAEVLLRPTLPPQGDSKADVSQPSTSIHGPEPLRRSKNASSSMRATAETVSWTNILESITELQSRLHKIDDTNATTTMSTASTINEEQRHETSSHRHSKLEMTNVLQVVADIDAGFVFLSAKMMYSVAMRMRACKLVCGQDDILRVILGEINPYPSIDEGKTESPLAVEARDQDISFSSSSSEFSSPLSEQQGSTSPPADDVVSETGTCSDTANSRPEIPAEAAHESLPRHFTDTHALPRTRGLWDAECNRAPVHMLLCIPALHLQRILCGDRFGHDVRISHADMIFALQAIGRYATLGRSRSQLVATGAVSILLSCALHGMRAAIDEGGACDKRDMSILCCSLRALLHLSRDKELFASAVSSGGTMVAHDAINQAREKSAHCNNFLRQVFKHTITWNKPQEPGLLDIVLIARALSHVHDERMDEDSVKAARSIAGQLLCTLSTSPLHRSALYGAELTFGTAAARSFHGTVPHIPDSARPMTAPTCAKATTMVAPHPFQQKKQAKGNTSPPTRSAQRHHSREQAHARARAKAVAGVQTNWYHMEDKEHVAYEAAEGFHILPTLRWDLSRPGIRSITDMGAGGFASMVSVPKSQWAPRLQGEPRLQRTEVSVRASIEKHHQMELLSAGHSLRKSSNSGAQELEKQKKLDEERWLSRRLRTRTAGAPHVNKVRNLIGVSSATDELRIVLEPNQRVTFPAAGAAGCRPNIIAAGDALMRRRKQASGARGFEQACGKTKRDTNKNSSTHLGRMSETENAQGLASKLTKAGTPQYALFRTVPGSSGKLYEGVTAPRIVSVGSGANAEAVYLYSSDGACEGGMLIDLPAQRSIGMPSFEELLLSEEEKRIRSIISLHPAQRVPSMTKLTSNMMLVSKAVSRLSGALQPTPPAPPAVAVATAAHASLNEALVNTIKRVPDPHWHSLLAPAICDEPLNLVVFGPSRAVTPPPPEPEPAKPRPIQQEEKEPEQAPEPEPEPPTPRDVEPVFDIFVARPFDNASKSFFSLPTRWEVRHEQCADDTLVRDTTREALAFDWSRCCRQRDFLSLIDGVAGTLCSSGGHGCSIGRGCNDLGDDLVAKFVDMTSDGEYSWVMAELRDIFEVLAHNYAVLDAVFAFYCSNSRDPFSMHMNEFNMFCRAARLTKGEGQIKQRDLDTLFIATNCVDADDEEEQKNNEADGICRHEMLELLVRIAIFKFRRGKMGWHGPASSVAEAVSMLFRLHICKISERCYANGPLCAVPHDTFRRETLYTEDITDALGPHVPILTAIHGWWCGTSSAPLWKVPQSLRHSFQWVAGGKKIQRMFWEDFLALFEDLELCNEDITRKELRLSFLQARAVVPDSIKHRLRAITLSSLDFLEALVRLARVSGSEDTPLHLRVDALASRVLTNFDNKWGDGDGRVTLADFEKHTDRRHRASRRLSKQG